jgi:hypothetical protein
MLQRVCIGAAILMGLAALANGLFMLVAPERWYLLVPGVTDCPCSDRRDTSGPWQPQSYAQAQRLSDSI